MRSTWANWDIAPPASPTLVLRARIKVSVLCLDDIWCTTFQNPEPRTPRGEEIGNGAHHRAGTHQHAKPHRSRVSSDVCYFIPICYPFSFL